MARADPLDRSGAHVADGEHARHARLERRGRAPSRVRAAAAPVSTKPCASSATPQPSSQRGLGVGADEQEHVADRALVLDAGAASRQETAARPLRRLAVQLRQLGVRRAARCSAWPRCGRSGSATCWRRGPGPRTSMWTLAACCARNTAAWPAELPPPTSTTSSAAHASPRARRPSTRRRGPRTRRAAARRAGDSARRWRSRPSARRSLRPSPRSTTQLAVGPGACSRAPPPAPGSASRRRTSAPARTRGRPAPGRRCRSESRGSSRCARWRRPGRRRRGVEHDDVQALGRRVHGGGEPGRPGADHGDVEELVARGRVDHAEAARQRLLGRIEQHRAVRDRPPARRRRPRRTARAAPRRRRPARRRAPGADGRCARRKFCRRSSVGRLRPPDQHRPAGAGLDQPDAAQDQRAHDALAEVGLGDDQRAQLLRRRRAAPRRRPPRAVDQRRRGPTACRPRPMNWPRPWRDDRHDVAQAVALADRDRALQHDEHAGPGLAGGEQARRRAR